MRTLLLALAPALSVALVLSAPQRPEPAPPRPRETPQVPVTHSEGTQKEIARTAKAMQGLWVLRELEWPRIQGVPSDFRGFCLVSENHLNFEVHIGLKNQNQNLMDLMLDSGLWRFEVGEGNRTVMTALIGSYIDQNNHIVFREEGTRVRYEVIALGDEMVWRKEDGQRLAFSRMLDGSAARVDIFGRPIPEEKKDEGDKSDAKKDDPKEQDH
ncbi:MAG: hypothetical protein IPJ19_06205 [Planctomycetes bacterium]|nr:hypothetical protein [Planctomycetota bacterium]